MTMDILQVLLVDDDLVPFLGFRTMSVTNAYHVRSIDLNFSYMSGISSGLHDNCPVPLVIDIGSCHHASAKVFSIRYHS